MNKDGVFLPPVVTTLFVFEIVVLFVTVFNVSLISGRTAEWSDDFLWAGIAIAGWVSAGLLYPPHKR